MKTVSRACFKLKTFIFKQQQVNCSLEQNLYPTNAGINIFCLPEEIIASILEYLDVKIVIRCESTSAWLREIIIKFHIYQRILDRKCRLQRVNNYMLLPVDISAEMSAEKCSDYYKKRLYHFMYLKLFNIWVDMDPLR